MALVYVVLCFGILLCHADGLFWDSIIRSDESADGDDGQMSVDDGDAVGAEPDTDVTGQQELTVESVDVVEASIKSVDGEVAEVVGSDVGAENDTALHGGTEASAEKPSKRSRPIKVTCLEKNETDVDLVVQIMNSTAHADLFKTSPNVTIAECALFLFYVPWCHFSVAAAPHFNALPRLYPDVQCIAVNAEIHTSLTARYGTIALPTLYLFHNGHPVAKFNESHFTLDNFVAFVNKYTGLNPVGIVNVTSADFEGPLPSIPVEETDYFLWLAWIFVISCCFYGFTKSSICHRMIESLRNNWHEAEAQHEHMD